MANFRHGWGKKIHVVVILYVYTYVLVYIKVFGYLVFVSFNFAFSFLLFSLILSLFDSLLATVNIMLLGFRNHEVEVFLILAPLVFDMMSPVKKLKLVRLLMNLYLNLILQTFNHSEFKAWKLSVEHISAFISLQNDHILGS